MLVYVCVKLQAWNEAIPQRMGGRAGVHNAVPDPDGFELRIRLQRDGAEGHAVVARPHSVAARHRPRRHRRHAQARRPLPFSPAPRRSRARTRSVPLAHQIVKKLHYIH